GRGSAGPWTGNRRPRSAGRRPAGSARTAAGRRRTRSCRTGREWSWSPVPAVGLEREREVHRLARGGGVAAPVAGQGLDQDQVRADGAAVHVDAELAGGAPHAQRDRAAVLVADGVRDQVAGEQDRYVRVDRGAPQVDGRADLAAGYGRRGRSGA